MELEIIPVDDAPGKFIIFRPRIGLAFVGNRALANLARKLASDPTIVETASSEVKDFLLRIGFFDPDPPPPASVNPVFRPTTAVLLLTNQCQLRCIYCYAAAGESPRHELTFDLGRVAIDQVCQNALDLNESAFEVSFHGGGEPTYAWKVLVACTEYARQKPLKAKITLTSNGIWSPKQCGWIIKNLDGLSLSLDGGPETQDSQRPFVAGKGSSAQVMRTVAELDSHHFPYGIRLTATAPWDKLPRDVRFLCENTGCHSMQVEPAFNTQRGGHGFMQAEDGMDFARAYLEAFDIAREAGRYLHYSGARMSTVTTTFCTAPYNALIVNGDGHLVTCYEVASPAHALAQMSIIGEVRDGQAQVDEAARNHLHRLMAERRDACQGCFCYWSCAGDCYARVFTDAPDGHQIRGVRCDINRVLTRELLLRRIADGNGSWRAVVQAAPLTGMNPETTQ